MGHTQREHPQLLVSVGEPSGDRAAARVVEELESRRRVELFGVGGGELRRAGMDLTADIADLAAIGPGDALRRIGGWARAWSRLRFEAERRLPSAALLVDAPEFNLPLARVLDAAGVRVVFYIGPQVWAWRPGRLGLLAERAEIVALILPFEKPIYDRAGVRAVHVGHPLLDEPSPRGRAETRRLLGVAGTDRLVAFLPGSRPGEVARHAGPMLGAVKRLEGEGVRCVYAPAPGAAGALMLTYSWTAGMTAPSGVSARDLLVAADGAVVASGTATLEAALARTPHVIAYRLDRLGWLAGRALVRVPFVGLPNWVAGRQVVPELLQDQLTSDRICARVREILEPGEARRQRAALGEVAGALGAPGAARRVASLVEERL